VSGQSGIMTTRALGRGHHASTEPPPWPTSAAACPCRASMQGSWTRLLSTSSSLSSPFLSSCTHQSALCLGHRQAELAPPLPFLARQAATATIAERWSSSPLLLCSFAISIEHITASASPCSTPRARSPRLQVARAHRRRAAPPTSHELSWPGHLGPLPGQLSPPSASPLHADHPASCPWPPSPPERHRRRSRAPACHRARG
jgi:hypothetical protein